jgi:L-iditol 2-dehydrogenase
MYYANRDVRLEESDAPAPGPGELLLRVEASGLCGSDVMEWYRRDKVPLVLGHEVAGVVEETGEGVETFRPGDRVAVSHHVPCNTCRHCHAGNHTACPTLRRTTFDPGGFAEQVRVPAINVDRGVYRLPEGVSFEEGTFAEPLACVLRAQRKMGVPPGASVFVIGSGISGLLHVALARATGAGRIVAVDVSDYRLEAARRFGADEALPAGEGLAERLRAANDGQGADRVILCTGVLEALGAGLDAVDRGGTVLFFAPTDEGVLLPLSINDVFWRTEVTLTTSYAGAPADHVAALELVRAGAVRVADMITHRFPLAEAQKGFALVEKGDASIKVIIEPQK